VSKETDQLIADIDSLLGKPKKQSVAKPAASKSDMQIANEISKNFNKPASWTPIARITYVTWQHCACCARATAFIGGEYVKYIATRSRTTIIRRTDDCADIFLFAKELPEQVDYFHQEVSRCPVCLHDETQVEQLWDLIVEPSPQLELTL